MDGTVLEILLEVGVPVTVSVIAVGLSIHAWLMARDNKREIRHHKEIDEALHGAMVAKMDGIDSQVAGFIKRWEEESKRDRDQRGKMWDAITEMKSDVSYIKGLTDNEHKAHNG